jgi:hypothetical protein
VVSCANAAGNSASASAQTSKMDSGPPKCEKRLRIIIPPRSFIFVNAGIRTYLGFKKTPKSHKNFDEIQPLEANNKLVVVIWGAI